jgi:AcrR family transcriptional regulator
MAERVSAPESEPSSALVPGIDDPESAAAKADALAGLSAKGLRTRQRLLEGARKAFEAKGSYVDTRISDIVKASGVAYGSFYTYFDSKEELFYELAVDVVNEMYVEGTSRYRGDNPLERINASNRQFLESYRVHAAMMTIIEQAAALYPEFRTLRRRLRQGFVDRIAANFQRLASAGRMDTSIDPVIAAHALVSMTDNFGYLWFVLGETFDEEQALATLTKLWVNSLGLESSVTPGS